MVFFFFNFSNGQQSDAAHQSKSGQFFYATWDERSQTHQLKGCLFQRTNFFCLGNGSICLSFLQLRGEEWVIFNIIFVMKFEQISVYKINQGRRIPAVKLQRKIRIFLQWKILIVIDHNCFISNLTLRNAVYCPSFSLDVVEEFFPII